MSERTCVGDRHRIATPHFLTAKAVRLRTAAGFAGRRAVLLSGCLQRAIVSIVCAIGAYSAAALRFLDKLRS
jgi:hypothetical protein